MNNETRAQLQSISDNMSDLNYDEILFQVWYLTSLDWTYHTDQKNWAWRLWRDDKWVRWSVEILCWRVEKIKHNSCSRLYEN